MDHNGRDNSLSSSRDSWTEESAVLRVVRGPDLVLRRRQQLLACTFMPLRYDVTIPGTVVNRGNLVENVEAFAVLALYGNKINTKTCRIYC